MAFFNDVPFVELCRTLVSCMAAFSNRRLDIKLILTQEKHAARKRFFLFTVWQYAFHLKPHNGNYKTYKHVYVDLLFIQQEQ